MAIDADLKKALNGTGVPGLFGPKSSEWALGTVIDEMHDELGGTTALSSIALDDNTAAALDIKQSSTSYLKFTTTNDAERLTIGKLWGNSVTTGTVAAPIDMAGAEHTLVLGTPASAETKLVGNMVFVDANTGSAPENLVLPSAATLVGVPIFIKNVGGEQVTVNSTVLTLEAGEGGFVVSDGTSWAGFGVGANT